MNQIVSKFCCTYPLVSDAASRRTYRGLRGGWWILSAMLMVLALAFDAQAKDNFVLQRSITLPGAKGGPLGVFPDGRLATVTADKKGYIETTPGSGSFNEITELKDADFSAFSPAFVAVSPDGSTVAVGNGGGAGFSNFQIGLLDVATLNVTWYNLNHFYATWIDSRYLVLTSGVFNQPSKVVVWDTQNPTTSAASPLVLVDGIGGASAGLALDRFGNLLTGNGFKSQNGGPSETGAVHVFRANDWRSVLNGTRNTALNFETEGTPVITALSANGLAFDQRGNFWVGGGSTFGANPVNDFVAVVDASAYENILNGQASAITSVDDNARVTKLDPDPATDKQIFSNRFVSIRNEMYVRDTGKATAFVYRSQASQATPAPVLPPYAFVAMGLGLLALGRAKRFAAA